MGVSWAIYLRAFPNYNADVLMQFYFQLLLNSIYNTFIKATIDCPNLSISSQNYSKINISKVLRTLCNSLSLFLRFQIFILSDERNSESAAAQWSAAYKIWAIRMVYVYKILCRTERITAHQMIICTIITIYMIRLHRRWAFHRQ